MKTVWKFPCNLDEINDNNQIVTGDGSGTGFASGTSTINLRGLGNNNTLVLINGRRANDYPFPYNGRSNFQNFNNIPSAAVERIEGWRALGDNVIETIINKSENVKDLKKKAKDGELGLGDLSNRSVPTQVGSDAWARVNAGGTHTCGVRQDLALFCWGLNSFGQLGLGGRLKTGEHPDRRVGIQRPLLTPRVQAPTAMEDALGPTGEAHGGDGVQEGLHGQELGKESVPSVCKDGNVVGRFRSE
mgnify:CR=1 FL=1